MLADPLDKPALVVYDGSPAATAAVGLLREPSRCAIWLAASLPGLQGAAAASAQRVAEATGLRRIEQAPAERYAGRSCLDDARLLLDAVDAAARLGLEAVVLPAALGDAGIDAIAAVVDRCALVSGLACLEAVAAGNASSKPAAVVSAPLVDLTDAQVADLLLDLALPLELCVVCEAGGETSCQACPGCRRWAKAMESARASFDVAEALPTV